MQDTIRTQRKDFTINITFITSGGNFGETIEVNSIHRAKSRAASIARKIWHPYCNIVIHWVFEGKDYYLVRTANKWGEPTTAKQDLTPDIGEYEKVVITGVGEGESYGSDIIGTEGYFTSCTKNLRTNSIGGCFEVTAGKGKLDSNCFKHVSFRAVFAKRGERYA